MRSFNFALTWYTTVVFTLVFSLLLLTHTTIIQQKPTPIGPKYQMYKALPLGAETNRQEVTIRKSDARALIVYRFFKQNNSPLADAADAFIDVADKYSLDYRLLPAISMQESNGGKIMPINSYNPFGYGVYGGKVMRFNSFEEAIERVGRGLRQDYFNQGLKTPDEIMAKYTPPSLKKGGAWAIGVNSFISELN